MSSGDCAQLLPRSSTAQQRPRDGLHRAQEMRLLPPRGCSSQYYHTALSCSDRTWDREYLYSVMNWATGRVGVRRAYSDAGTPDHELTRCPALVIIRHYILHVPAHIRFMRVTCGKTGHYRQARNVGCLLSLWSYSTGTTGLK